MKEIAIVTGGNSGLGLEMAKELATKGIHICIIGRNEIELESAYRTIKDLSNVDVLKFAGNVSNEEFVKRIYEKIAKEYEIKFLYNVAGIGRVAPPEDTTKEVLEQVLEANLIGLILMCSNALKYMKEQKEGTIVNIMSSAAKSGNPNESLYCAAKWGARGYTESLNAWSKGTKIKVIGVYPGGIKTPFWDRDLVIKPDISNFMDPEELAKQIIFSTTNKDTIKVSDISINRI